MTESTNSLVDRVKLIAVDSKAVPSRAAYQLKSLFENEVKKLGPFIEPLAKDFSTDLSGRIVQHLKPSLQVGARNGNNLAMSTVQSWGSTAKRRRGVERSLERNGT